MGWSRAALVLVLATGCSDGGGAPAPRSTATGPSPAPAVTTTGPGPTVSPTGRASGTLTPSGSVTALAAPGSKDFGYFPAVVSSGPPVRLSFDRAQFLTGDAANRAAAGRGDETPVPNDYYVVNDNRRLRTLALAGDVQVFGSQALNGYAGDRSVEARPRTVPQLLGFVGTAQGKETGFNLVYGSGGVVLRVEEQYQP
jgi:hypothetical protein